LPILERQSSTFFEAAETTCKTSGSDVPGIPREGRLVGNQTKQLPSDKYANGRSSFLNAALGREINREAAEPVAAFVMLASNRCEPGTLMRFCCAR